MAKLKKKVKEFKKIELIENVRFILENVTIECFVRIGIAHKLFGGLKNVPNIGGKPNPLVDERIQSDAISGRETCDALIEFLKHQEGFGEEHNEDLESICSEAAEIFIASSGYSKPIKVESKGKYVYYCIKKELVFLIYLTLSAMYELCPKSELSILLNFDGKFTQIGIHSNVEPTEEEIKEVNRRDGLEWSKCLGDKLSLVYGLVRRLDEIIHVKNEKGENLSFVFHFIKGSR